MPKTSQSPVKQGTLATLLLKKGEYLKSKIASLPAGMIDKRYHHYPGFTCIRIKDQADIQQNQVYISYIYNHS